MKRLGLLLLLGAACAKPAPPAPPVACDAPPTGISAEEFRTLAAEWGRCDTEACQDAVIAKTEGKLIEYHELMDAAADPPAAAAALEELRAIDRDACACADAACADQAEADANAWVKRHENTHGNTQQTNEAGEVAAHLWACLDAARAAGGE